MQIFKEECSKSVIHSLLQDGDRRMLEFAFTLVHSTSMLFTDTWFAQCKTVQENEINFEGKKLFSC